MKRRTFLIGAGTATGGALALGFLGWDAHFKSEAKQLAEESGGHLLAGWMKIADDDRITVLTPGVDVGQGAQTALAMMLAEELDADWSNIRVETAPAEKAFADRFLVEGYVLHGRSLGPLQGFADMVFAEVARDMNIQMTGGSTAVAYTGQYGLRIVGAAARAMLIATAADRLAVAADQLETQESTVIHRPSGRKIRYGSLAADAARRSVPAQPRLKPKKEYQLVGRSLPRLDIPAKVTGALKYGIDFALPDMRWAAIKAAPVHGGRLLKVDPRPGLAVKGVERVVPLDDAVAVIARSYWQAHQGLAALSPIFSNGGNGRLTTESLFQRQQHALNGEADHTDVAIGDVAGLASKPGVRILEAEYRVPFLAHAPIEPISAVAQFKGGRLSVWASDRDPLASKMALVEATGLSASQVAFTPLPSGGCFGARSAQFSAANIYLVHAARIAREITPFPIKLMHSREEDFAQDAFRPQLSTRLRGMLGKSGGLIGWDQIYITGAPSRASAFDIPYMIPNKVIRGVTLPHHIQVGSWRSVNSSQHAFWSESFIDELAYAAGRDPYRFRRALLPPGSRAQRVLDTVAMAADWDAPLSAGLGRGIALVPSFDTIVAEVVEAAFDSAGVPRVRRIIAAVDCGDLVHPDNAEQQVQGAIVMGLSAALREQITIANGHVTQTNFPDYRLLSLADTPPIEVHFIRSDSPLGGLGEVGVPPTAPALANALFAASSRRIRALPIITNT